MLLIVGSFTFLIMFLHNCLELLYLLYHSLHVFTHLYEVFYSIRSHSSFDLNL